MHMYMSMHMYVQIQSYECVWSGYQPNRISATLRQHEHEDIDSCKPLV